jgi:8-oxo-dGTP pyrophosphatase MutT (NUDIX family)
MQACAIRETAEETGLRVTVGHCLFVYEIGDPKSSARSVELVFAAISDWG